MAVTYVPGAEQTAFAGVVTPTTVGTYSQLSAAGTYTAVNAYTVWVVTLMCPSQSVYEPTQEPTLSVNGANVPFASGTAYSTGAPQSTTIAMYMLPPQTPGAGVAFDAVIKLEAHTPTVFSHGPYYMTVAVVELQGTVGPLSLAAAGPVGTSSVIQVTSTGPTPNNIILAAACSTGTFATASAGVPLPNTTFGPPPTLTPATAAPFSVATMTGVLGTGDMFSGNMPLSLDTTGTTGALMLALTLQPTISPTPVFADADLRVPGVYDVQIDDQTYLIDYSQPFYRQFSEQLDTITRTQADGGATTGENSMDPKGLWRRSQEDWRMGAGQTWLDRKQSNNQNSLPNGFDFCKGLEMGQAWQSTPLPASNKQIYEDPLPTSPFKLVTMPTMSGPGLNPGVICYSNIGSDAQIFAFTSGATAPAPPAITGAPTIMDFCSDGSSVYAATSSGVWVYQAPVTNFAGGTWTQIATNALNKYAKIGFFNGRLILCQETKIWNITSTTAAALGTTNTGVNPLIYTSGAANTWFTAIGGGLSGIYVASNSVDSAGVYADNGQVWLITMGSDGLQLNPPQIAGQVQSNESIMGMLYYLNNLVLYTTAGVRCCAVNSDGSITLGTIIQNPAVVGTLLRSTPNQPVNFPFNMAGQGDYVYFPLSNFDLDPTQASGANPQGVLSTGVGRLDLGNFVVSGLLPAWQPHCYLGTSANQSIVPGLGLETLSDKFSGLVTSVATIPALWTVPNNDNALPGGVAFGGVCDALTGSTAGWSFVGLESTTPVPVGYFTTGKIAYDLVDNKVLGAIDVQGRNFQGIYSSINVDDGGFNEIELASGTTGTANLTFPLNSTGSHFEVGLGLTSTSLVSANTPTIIRWTLRAYPAPTRPIQWTLPIMLNEDLGNLTGQGNGYDVRVALETLYSLVNTGKQVTFRRGVETFVVYLSDISFLPDTPSENGNTLRSFFNGMAYVTINSLPDWQSTIQAG